MKPRKKCMKLEEVLELVLANSEDDDDDEDSSDCSDFNENLENSSFKKQILSVDVECKSKENNIEIEAKEDTSFKKNITDNENKVIRNTFHLKNLFHFVDKIDFKISEHAAEKNDLIIYDTSSDDDDSDNESKLRKNNKNLLKSPVIDLMYQMRQDIINHKISKKRKRN